MPDGKLHLLPLDIVVTRNEGAGRIVSTVPSPNVLYLLRTRQPVTMLNQPLFAMAAFRPIGYLGGKPAPSSQTRTDETRGFFDAGFPSNLPNLATARMEVLTAARWIGPGSVALTGEDATETRLKREDLRPFGIVHFAANAFADLARTDVPPKVQSRRRRDGSMLVAHRR